MPILGASASGAKSIPVAPTIGTATNVGTSRAYNNGSATVTFTAPDSKLPITSYTVTSSPSSYTGTGSSSPITVAGLQSATAYTFTVTATSAVGTSSASSASNSITATTVPVAPTVGTASITNSTTVSLAFTAGATGGSAITSYTVASSPSIALSTSGSSTPLTVTGTFVSGTAYTFTITATNANGSSTASSASNSITPNPLIYSFYYGNTGFTSSYGLYKTSDGATTWSTASSGLSAGQSTSPSRGIDGQRNLASNGTGTIVAGGNYLSSNNDQNVAYYSTNSGTSWSAVVMGSPASGNSISYSTGRATYGNGLYAVCQSGSSVNYRSGVWSSSNLSSWSFANTTPSNLGNVASLVYSPYQTKFWLGTSDGKYRSSTDLVTWTTITGNTMEQPTASAANGNAAGWVVAGQSNVRWYYSGSAWTSNAEPYGNVVTDVTWGDGRYVSIAALTNINTDNTLAYSTNGTTWTEMASPVGGYSPSPQRIHYQNGLWYLSMSNYDVYTSTSGTGSWTKKTASNFLLQSMTSST